LHALSNGNKHIVALLLGRAQVPYCVDDLDLSRIHAIIFDFVPYAEIDGIKPLIEALLSRLHAPPRVASDYDAILKESIHRHAIRHAFDVLRHFPASPVSFIRMMLKNSKYLLFREQFEQFEQLLELPQLDLVQVETQALLRDLISGPGLSDCHREMMQSKVDAAIRRAQMRAHT
jgi:hypothetical protein